MAAIVRYIKKGKKTQEHLATLQSKGYQVADQGEVLAVTCTGVIEGEVDISTPEKAAEALRGAVAQQKVFSYETSFKFADGKTLHGVFACGKLGKASALITKGEEKKAPKVNGLDDIFSAL